MSMTTEIILKKFYFTSKPYAVINCRWPSFSGCCSWCLEQSTASRHIRAVTASLPQSP